MSKQFLADGILDLQLFAEGGDGAGTGAEGTSGVSDGASLPSTKGVKNPLANVKYGKQTDTDTTDPQSNETTAAEDETEDRLAKFESMIKGEYKDLYDARVQDIVQKRIKGTKETVDRYNALTPTIEMLAKKYGVDASDIKALNKAIEEDDSYYEDEALERGMSVENLKAIRKMERENSELKRQMDQQKADEEAKRIYSDWLDQSEKAKAKYPSLDLNTEIQNPQFASLLKNGVDVETAYTVIHKDDIIPAMIQYTQKETMRKVANNIMANGSRPIENGLSSHASIQVKDDVSKLTKEDRAEIIRRVSMGEKISF